MTFRGWSDRRKENERGTALLEFAFVGILFLFIILAALDFGWAFMIRENMIHAAQEGLRQALVQPTDASRDSTARTTTNSRLTGVTKSSGLTVATNLTSGAFPTCVASDGTSIANTECMTVTVTYDYKDNSLVALPWIDSLFPSAMHVSATQQVK